MLLAEYDYDTDIAVQRREAFDDGISIGRKEGISIGLSQGRDEGIAIGEERGIFKGAHQKAVETARNALTMNLSVEQVAILTGLSVEEIEKL